jgi:hypothetical protein
MRNEWEEARTSQLAATNQQAGNARQEVGQIYPAIGPGSGGKST